jgi:hypothetical protein
MLILTAFLTGMVILAMLVLMLFRLLVRYFGIKDLVEDGAVLTEEGIEYLRPFWAGRGKLKLCDIKSARLVSFPRAMLSLMFLGYGFSVHSIRSRFFSDFVELKIRKTAKWYEFHFDYLLFTPKDPVAFVEQLNNRLHNMPIILN